MPEREIEVRGKNVEAAIESGLAQLGASRHEVQIVVVDEGSRGLLGLGVREAVVRLTKTAVTPPPARPTPAPKAVEAVVPEPTPASVPQAPVPPVSVPTPAVEAVVASPTVAQPTPVAVEAAPILDTPAEEDKETAVAELQGQYDLAVERDTAVELITTLLEKLDISAEITASLSEPDNLTGQQINVIEINGSNLADLVGARGDTLNALQYLSRLMVSHKLHQRTDFIIDIDHYRSRREQALARLAERMAQKAIQQKRPINLEPMPPNERRVIHMTLRNYGRVKTESIGEGEQRKVRIVPTK